VGKTTKNLRQKSLCLGQDSNRAPLECKSEVLPFEDTYSYDDVLFDELVCHFGENATSIFTVDKYVTKAKMMQDTKREDSSSSLYFKPFLTAWPALLLRR